MTAINLTNNTSLSIQCQSEVLNGVLRCTGTFTRIISLPSDRNELDFVIEDVEQFGQQIKRNIAVSVLEAFGIFP
ncbi:MAG: hypothetical protein LBE12_08100 [Planctomycetaceae bacterium]|nr:hypothetical protein [Planctomycetaceae bacterium]